jgi:DNA modification methylase
VSSRLLAGHAPDVLAGLEPESCHLAVTSPPYWNLRAYGTEPQIWPNPDGTPLCADGAHEWDERRIGWDNRYAAALAQGLQERGLGGSVNPDRSRAVATCARCGAMRCELGQEPTVERYIADLVFVFDAVRRVLRRDGLCWVNLSGSFFNNPGGQNGTSGNVSARAIAANGQAGRQDRIGAAGKDSWLKPLDWVDTPGLFAHAMQKRGWYWRADIALIKVNPLPESVQGWRFERCRVKAERRISVTEHEARGHTVPAAWDVGQHAHDRGADSKGRYDQNGQTMVEWADCPGCDKCSKTDGLILRRGNGRPTRAWERFLIFAKAPGAYWDSDAVREPSVNPLSWDEYAERTGPGKGGWGELLTLRKGVTKHYGGRSHPNGRNLKDWQFWPTTGGVGGEAHYAAYPIPLAELAIRASTSERGVCPKCAAPWARVVERTSMVIRRSDWGEKAGNRTPTSGTMLAPPTSETTGWRPTCSCNAGAPVPATVLDLFVGSGSTLIAADRLGRSAICIDVHPQYIELAARRARRDAPLFATVEVERQAEAASKQRDLFSVLAEQEGAADAAD